MTKFIYIYNMRYILGVAYKTDFAVLFQEIVKTRFTLTLVFCVA